MTPSRTAFYASSAASTAAESLMGLSALGPLFHDDDEGDRDGGGGANIVFVRLQYDECAAELRAIRRLHGVGVWDAGVDLFDDLDDSAALIAALDAVVTPMVSTLDLAGALGTTPVFAFAPTAVHERFLGEGARGRFPWYRDVKVFAQQPAWSGSWTGVFRRIRRELTTTLWRD